MELKEFISSTLCQIIDGIKDAQEKHDAFINPKQSRKGPTKEVYIQDEYGKPITDISFDIAVTAEDKSDAEGGAKISVMSLGFGGKMSETNLSKTASRIQFEIPICYPRSGEEKN